MDWNLDVTGVDQQLRKLAIDRNRISYQVCVGLRRAHQLRAHELGGFGSFHEYVHRLFQYSGSQTEERLRVAERLDELPDIATAFARGELTFSAVRELTRVATPDTEADWIEASEGRTSREIESMVSGRDVGELPDGPSRPEPEIHRVTLKLPAHVYALFREARRALVKETGSSVDDEALIAEMARRLLGEPEEGHSGYRIAITVCERCRTATQSAGGESVTIDETARQTACCDAQSVGRVDLPDPPRATESVPPKRRRAVLARHEHRCGVPGCRSSAFLHIHHIDLRSEGGTHDPERLIALCGLHHQHVHEGRLVIGGTFSTGFTFQHADGTPYGSPRFHAARAEVMAQAFSALCAMGYKQKEARAIVDAVPHVGLEPKMPDFLYAALRHAPVPAGAGCVREARAKYERAA